MIRGSHANETGMVVYDMADGKYVVQFHGDDVSIASKSMLTVLEKPADRRYIHGVFGLRKTSEMPTAHPTVAPTITMLTSTEQFLLDIAADAKYIGNWRKKNRTGPRQKASP